jgi:hypothetical protein
MKKLLLLFCLIPSLLLADDFIILWLNKAASAADKVTVRDGLYTLLNDRSKINAEALPQWRLIANTNIIGYVCVINTNNLTLIKTDQSKMTLSKLNTWKKNNMDNPNHLQWRRATDWKQELTDAGLEPVPTQKAF